MVNGSLWPSNSTSKSNTRCLTKAIWRWLRKIRNVNRRIGFFRRQKRFKRIKKGRREKTPLPSFFPTCLLFALWSIRKGNCTLQAKKSVSLLLLYARGGFFPIHLVATCPCGGKAFAVLDAQAERAAPIKAKKDASKDFSKKGSARASVEASASDSAMADSSNSKLFDGRCLGKSRRFYYINYHGIRGSDSRLLRLGDRRHGYIRFFRGGKQSWDFSC